MDIQNLGLVFQIIALILSIIFYKKYNSIFYKILCLFLIVVVITESIGAYHIKHKLDSFRWLLVCTLLQFNLIALMYAELLKNKIFIKIIIALSVLFSLYAIQVYFVKSSFPFLAAFGGLNTSLFSFLYLRELLVSTKIINYKKLLPFWVSVGFFIFYLASVPFFTMMTFMNDRGLFYLISTLIIVMNAFIIIGLIFSKKEASLN